MPKHQGHKACDAARNKGRPYAKAGTSNNEENEPNQTICDDNELAVCPVCDIIIQEPTEDSQSAGDEAVFCEGKCEAWFHRKCAGLSKTAFLIASESECPFIVCIVCKYYMQMKLLS